MPNIVEELAARFHPSEVKQRDGGRGLKLDYIDIPQTIKRLRNVLGMNVSWDIQETTLVPTDDGKYLATVTGYLTVTEFDETENKIPAISRWGGVGAMVDRDPDMALKTAQAEAIKKAGHGFQIALYLWDEEERNAIAAYRTASTSEDLNALKKAVAMQAKVRGVPTTPKALAEFYGVKEEELQNPKVLRELIEP